MRFKVLRKLVSSKLQELPLEVKLPKIVLEEGQLDPYSPTWIYMQNWIQKELLATRERNDYLKNDEIKTAALRGRIKLLKEILDLPQR